MGEEHHAQRVAIARWIFACLVIFFVMGLGFGTWLSRLPAVRDELGASTLHMSVYGLCLAAGSLAGMLCSGAVIERLGPRRMMVSTISAQLVLLPGAVTLMLAGLVVPGVVLLLLYGCCFSATDVAMNVSGAHAERVRGLPRLSYMHACYSIGVMCAMGIGAAAEALRVPLPVHFLGVAALIGLGALGVLGFVPKHERRDERGARPPLNARRTSVWRDRRVVLIGLITLSAGMLEGSPADWLPLALVDGRGVSNEFAAVVLGLFYAAVVASRLAGSALLIRFGRVAVLRTSLICAGVSVLAVSLLAHPAVMLLGVIVWGAGAGICWPITISAAADRHETAARDVAAVSAIGYASMLIGPAAFGLLGEQIGLLPAFLALLLFAVLGLLLAGQTAQRSPGNTPG